MGIINVLPTWSSNDSDASIAPDFNPQSRRRSDRLAWTCLVADAADYTANTLHKELHANWGFQVGGLHPTDNYLRATSIRVARTAPILFNVDVTFNAQGSEPDKNPLDEPARILPSFIGSQERVDQDFKGNPLVNKSGEPLDQTSDIYDLVLNIRRNMPAFDFQLAWLYMGDGKGEPAHNSDTFLGFPPGTARVMSLLPEEVDTEDFVYWRVTGTFQFRRKAPKSDDSKAWFKRVLHQGFYMRNPFDLNAPPVRAVDGEGKDATSPVLLDANGLLIPWVDGQQDPAKAVWLEFQMGDALPFNNLGFFS